VAAIGELYHVSRSSLFLWNRLLILFFQRNVLRWERGDLLGIPASVDQFVRALHEMQAWIASGGIVESVMVAAPPTLS